MSLNHAKPIAVTLLTAALLAWSTPGRAQEGPIATAPIPPASTAPQNSGPLAPTTEKPMMVPSTPAPHAAAVPAAPKSADTSNAATAAPPTPPRPKRVVSAPPVPPKKPQTAAKPGPSRTLAARETRQRVVVRANPWPSYQQQWVPEQWADAPQPPRYYAQQMRPAPYAPSWYDDEPMPEPPPYPGSRVPPPMPW